MGKIIEQGTQPNQLVDRVDSLIKRLNKGVHPSGELPGQAPGVRLG
jgi:hypothetical protein